MDKEEFGKLERERELHFLLFSDRHLQRDFFFYFSDRHLKRIMEWCVWRESEKEREREDKTFHISGINHHDLGHYLPLTSSESEP